MKIVGGGVRCIKTYPLQQLQSMHVDNVLDFNSYLSFVTEQSKICCQTMLCGRGVCSMNKNWGGGGGSNKNISGTQVTIFNEKP